MVKKKDILKFQFTSDVELRGNKLREFILAGNATFTILNTESKNRFTFNIKKHKQDEIFFVSVMTGTDNNSSYTFLGTYFPTSKRFVHSKRSSISNTAMSAKTIGWFFKSYTKSQNSFPTVKVYHAGKCGRCNRKLTTPKSITDGYGPECINKPNG
jgi:hypothetical protein